MGRNRHERASLLLLNEEPLQVLPSLAVLIGLNEAIVLQQMHYWLLRNPHVIDEVPWIYNSYKQWRTQFPFWSAETIKRAITSLEKQQLIQSANFNANPIDKTKWYTIRYDILNALPALSIGQNDPSIGQNDPSIGQNDPSIGQNDPSMRSKRPVHEVKMTRSKDTEIPAETPTKIPPIGPPKGTRPATKGSRPARRPPAAFAITPERRTWAAQECPGLDIDYQHRIFLDHEFQKPHSDWPATWRNWMRRAHLDPTSLRLSHNGAAPLPLTGWAARHAGHDIGHYATGDYCKTCKEPQR